MAAEPRGGFRPPALGKWFPLAVVAVILVGVAATLLARELVSSDPPPEPPKRTAAEFVRFRDAAAGLSIAHPAAWQRASSPDPEVRLLAIGEGSSMLVRLADLGVEIGPGNVGAARKITDKLIRAIGRVELLRPPQQVTLSGLPGYLYLYTFPDAATGQRGAHAHYFLFRGRTLITIVFQTVPAEGFTALAPLFDRLGDSLQVGPG